MVKTLACLVVLFGCVFANNAQLDSIAAAIRSDWPHVSNETSYKVAALVLLREPLTNETAAPKDAINCPTYPSRAPPTSIRLLRPQDVAVVGAVGDSVTTASNALSTTWLNLLTYPGLSWSMGGDADRITVANMLKHFNPSLYGASLGTGNTQMFFNHAVGGATVQDIESQINLLLSALRQRPNYNTEWKVVTLFVGGNNLCDICTEGGMDRHGPTIFANHLRNNIRQLAGVPRLFVNLVFGFRYSQLHQFVGPFCSLAMPFLCTCITSSNEEHRLMVDRMSLEYNAAMQRVAAEFPTSDSFAVVVQPFLSNTIIPDRSYISQADCFHPSGTGQRMFGIGLWNNMIEPVGQKATSITAATPYKCPGETTLLYTP